MAIDVRDYDYQAGESIIKLHYPSLPLKGKLDRTDTLVVLVQDGRYLGAFYRKLGVYEDDDSYDANSFRRQNDSEEIGLDNPRIGGFLSKGIQDVDLYAAYFGHIKGDFYAQGSFDTGRGIFRYHTGIEASLYGLTKAFVERCLGNASGQPGQGVTPNRGAASSFARGAASISSNAAANVNGSTPASVDSGLSSEGGPFAIAPAFRFRNEKGSYGPTVAMRNTDWIPFLSRALGYALAKVKPFLADEVCRGRDFNFNFADVADRFTTPDLCFGVYDLIHRNPPVKGVDLDLWSKIVKRISDAMDEYMKAIDLPAFHSKFGTCYCKACAMKVTPE